MGEKGRGVGEPDSGSQILQHPKVTDVAACDEIGGEERLQHGVLPVMARGQAEQAMGGEGVRGLPDALEMEVETFAGAHGRHRVVDPLRPLGPAELGLDIAAALHALGGGMPGLSWNARQRMTSFGCGRMASARASRRLPT